MASVDFTKGSIKKQLLFYAFPLLLTSIFGELYNVINALIVGNYVSTHALSAVSACSWICNIFNYTFHGLGLGAGILIANLYGAKDQEKLKTAMDTSIVFSIVGGVLLTLIAELFLYQLLDICNVSADLHAEALAYLRVYLIGNTAVLTYQMCFFIMRSMGNSKQPLYFLILSSFINIVLGVIFVRVFNMSVVGTALATIISQFVVDFLSLKVLFSQDEFKFDGKNISFSFEVVKRICELGIPAGIQNLLIALSSMMVQSYVNMFPNEVIAGVGVAEKVANWAQMPSLALANSCVSIVSQNIGAQNYERAKKIIKDILIISSFVTVVAIIVIYLGSPFLVSCFNQDPEVILNGTKMTRVIIISFISLNLSHLFNGACRASGNVKVPMLIAIFAQVICKFLFVYIGLKISFRIEIIYYGTAFGFTMAGILAALYFYLSSYTKRARLR